ncbi:LysR family transcriptional regulator [Undibacterium parvum]|jgi:DNA-binding transcriptional LysR family regulator|uniref:LysR family transcriptional regulator n=1 Tax=Undibacterium parvum TaxID=401471 RepID=A0A3Q9BR69_9BURK|nr:LysR family transcriptional regulator [Undibacterium parvum]AZP11794.1 LysR family transcriptional regulator [Undibacterium parvum]
MDKLHLMTVFVAVAEEEGFAAGARRMGMSPPAVTRAIAALEARLRIKLLNRSTRFVRVTDAGQRYLDDARRIIAEVETADEAAAGINAEPRGHLAVTAPVLFGKMFVMPGIVDYLNRYPGMDVSALFLDRVVNLLEEGIDVGIRIGELPDSSMKAIRVGQICRVLCATPAYLEQHAALTSPADLAQHCIVAASGVTPFVEWKFGQDSKTTIRVKPRLTVSSNDAAIEASLLGLGISRLLSYQVAAHFESGKLLRLMPDYEPQPLPVHVVHRESRYASTKVRSFVDLIVSQLRGQLEQR